MNSPDVLVSIDEKIYSSKDAMAIIVSWICFKQSHEAVDLRTFAVDFGVESPAAMEDVLSPLPLPTMEKFHTCDGPEKPETVEKQPPQIFTLKPGQM